GAGEAGERQTPPAPRRKNETKGRPQPLPPGCPTARPRPTRPTLTASAPTVSRTAYEKWISVSLGPRRLGPCCGLLLYGECRRSDCARSTCSHKARRNS